MNRIIVFFACLVIGCTIHAQETETVDEEKRATIYLKTGSELDVTILDWKEDLGIKVLTIWGQEMFFPADKIKKVKSLSSRSFATPYVFKDKGIYYSMAAGLITGNSGIRNNESNGYTLSFSSGYRFNRLASLGIGTSVDQFAHGSGERMHPIFLEFRSFLMPRNSTFVFNLQTGYSLAFKNENKGISDAKGGLFIYPSLGMSFGGSETKYFVDLGYKFQDATWTYANQWDIRNKTEFRLDYQRFVLRFGIVL